MINKRQRCNRLNKYGKTRRITVHHIGFVGYNGGNCKRKTRLLEYIRENKTRSNIGCNENNHQ